MAGNTDSSTVNDILTRSAEKARAAGVFADVRVDGSMLVCVARDAAAHAEYRLFEKDGEFWVGMFTPDRWLSQSIEADLVHTGDKLEDLIDEELTDLGCDLGPLSFEHFRDEDMQYVFRSRAPLADALSGDASAAIAASCLLAYEAAMRELGDMSGEDED